MKKVLWLDDIRNPLENNWVKQYSPIPEPYETIWVTNYGQFVQWIRINSIPDAVCFDHDLGLEVQQMGIEQGLSKRQARKLKQEEKTGYDCAVWLIEYCKKNKLELPLWNVHSFNPVGKERIRQVLLGY